jgi:DME family drug/metabolite transporter
MTATTTSRTARLVGYACAIGAGALWGTTGPLSTALYNQGADLTTIGFWRLLLGIIGLLAFGLTNRDLFRIDKRGLLLIGVLGGLLVAVFEIAYQFAIAGAGVAGAAAMLYTAPVLVAVAARFVLHESLTPVRFGLAVAVVAGAIMTVKGGSNAGAEAASAGLLIGVMGGGLSALSYAGTTLLARYAVPRYGVARVLFFEILGGLVALGIFLPAWGHPPIPPPAHAWPILGLLAATTVLAANFFFFAAVKRIQAAPAAVAATIEPVVGTMLALGFFNQRLSGIGWLGLAMVIGGVAGGYVEEARSPSST